jgi:hypothetical protein
MEYVTNWCCSHLKFEFLTIKGEMKMSNQIIAQPDVQAESGNEPKKVSVWDLYPHNCIGMLTSAEIARVHEKLDNLKSGEEPPFSYWIRTSNSGPPAR